MDRTYEITFKNINSILFLFLIFQFVSVSVCAQQSINTLGANIKTQAGSISYTLGQIDYISIESSHEWMNHGVQQPFLSMKDVPNEPDGCIVFPNPTFGLLYTNLTDPEIISLRYEIYNMNGVLVVARENIKIEDQIDVSNILPGVYFIKIVSKKGKEWECRIIKI